MRHLIGALSIFGTAPLRLRFRVTPETFSLQEVARTLTEIGAVIKGVDVNNLDCALPVSQFVRRIGYRRKQMLACSVEIQTSGDVAGPIMVATCDLDGLRRVNRFTFYAASLFIALLIIWPLLRLGTPGSPWLLLLPWPVVEMNFNVDRTRLRSKLRNVLASVEGIRGTTGDIAGSC